MRKCIMSGEYGRTRSTDAIMARFAAIGIIAFLLSSLGFCQAIGGSYRIQPDDRLFIQVFDESQIQGEVVVTQDGKITPPFAGSVVAVGKTTSELEAELADIYEKKLRIKSPKVSVSIRSVRKILASISGVGVPRPNSYEVRPGMTVRDLCAMGGVDDRAGDLRRATFRRKGWTETIPLDLYNLNVTGSLSQNYEILDGDEISVPPKKNYNVRVFGEVGAPRVLEYVEEMDLVAAVTSAGGAIPNRAKQSKVVVIRPKPGVLNQYFMIECNLVNFTKKRDFAQNIKLMPGDTVYVPNNGNPDFSLLTQVANAIFILDRVGLGFGFLKGG